jgi:uncharacterized tellurite resistance protein B-like protein
MRHDRVSVLTDLLLGAAWADDHFSTDERRELRRVLSGLLGLENAPLPLHLEERIESFDPLAFDLVSVAKEFDQDPPTSRERLVALVAGLATSDGDVTAPEAAFLSDLVQALGLGDADWRTLAASGDDRELRGLFEQLRAAPPPIVNAEGVANRPPPPPLVEDPPTDDD